MRKIKILFVCIHNSARSQMAEAFINDLKSPQITAESAGLEPGQLNPLVVEAMKELGIDISANRTKSIQEFFKPEKHFDYVITVCDEASAERCPVFPGASERLHWSFEDPSQLQGSHQEKLKRAREIRDEIKSKIVFWIKEVI